MLTELKIEKFQGFQYEQIIPLKPLTLIYGPNASGKSSIIRSLLMMKQTSKTESQTKLGLGQPGFNYEGTDISLASFANAIYRHDVTETLTFGFTIALSTNKEINAENTKKHRFKPWIQKVESIRYTWSASEYEPIVGFELLVKTLDSEESIVLNFEYSKNKPKLRKVQNVHVLAALFAQETFVFGPKGFDLAAAMSRAKINSKKKEDENKDILSRAITQAEIKKLKFDASSLFPELSSDSFVRTEAKSDVELDQNLLAMRRVEVIYDLLNACKALSQAQFAKVQHIGPVREILGRLNFHNEPSTSSPIRVSNRRSEKEIEKVISKWIMKLTDNRYSFETKYSYASEVKFLGVLKSDVIRDNLTNTEVTFADVGVGLSHVKPILESLGYALENSGSVLLVEQPELHLHPKMQGDLAELLVDSVTADGGTQIIVETHSESMLLRIQKLIRKGKLDPSMVGVLYVGANDKSGQLGNSVNPLSFDNENGFNLQMPTSFSDLRLDDLV
jgi:predicted ATPase